MLLHLAHLDRAACATIHSWPRTGLLEPRGKGIVLWDEVRDPENADPKLVLLVESLIEDLSQSWDRPGCWTSSKAGARKKQEDRSKAE